MNVKRKTNLERATLAFFAAMILLLGFGASQASATDEARDFAGPGSATPYIVGGSGASALRHPWQVLITANGAEFCGGVLIHPMIVLTAAHCLLDEDGEYFEDRPGLEFRLYTGRTQTGSGGQELDWRISNANPTYNLISEENDWGFISLNSPASAETIKLAGPGEAALWKPGRKATVTGYGNLNEEGLPSLSLQQLNLPVLADNACSRYGSRFKGSSMLCAGYLAGSRDSCLGDSGGPLSVSADGGARRLVGLVSWGDGCARAGFPGVYTRIADPSISQGIQQQVESIEKSYDFPKPYTGIDVVGSGLKPLGCAAARKSQQRAGQRVKSKARALKAARKKGNRGPVKAAQRGLKVSKRQFDASRKKARGACS